MERITPQFLINLLCKFKWYHRYCDYRRLKWIRKNNWFCGNY